MNFYKQTNYLKLTKIKNRKIAIFKYFRIKYEQLSLNQ